MTERSVPFAAGVLALIAALTLAEPVPAQDGAPPSPPDQPCNDLCRWWMAIGREPAPEPTATLPSTPADPARRMEALVPSPIEPPARPVPLALLRRTRPEGGRAAEPARPAAVGIAIPPRKGGAASAAPPTRSLWNAPIDGGSPILTTAFVRP